MQLLESHAPELGVAVELLGLGRPPRGAGGSRPPALPPPPRRCRIGGGARHAGVGARAQARAPDAAGPAGHRRHWSAPWTPPPPLGEITWPVSHVHSATSTIALA